jgi:hypothetical protein
VFLPGKKFQQLIMFVAKARSLPKSGAPDISSFGQAPALLERLASENTLAYYVRSFIT